MNFHQRQAAAETRSGHGIYYEAVTGQESPGRSDAVQRLLATATAPLLGSRRVFPRRFDHAYERLIENPESIDVIPEYAIRYFGEALHLEIDPAKLEHRISDWVRDHRGLRWVGTSFLDAADWSAAISTIDRSPVHREMHEIVAAGADFRDTRAYKNLMGAIRLGRPSKRNNIRLATTEAVEAYLRYCRGLIKSMRKRGAMRRAASGAFHGIRVRHWDARSPVYDSSERDVGVAVSESGEIIRHLGGKHRTAIAQALGLKTLPVEVRMVHTGWLRRQIEQTGLPPHRALVEGLRALGANGDLAPPDTADKG